MNRCQAEKRPAFDSPMATSEILIDAVRLVIDELIELIRVETQQFLVEQADDIVCREYLKPISKRFKPAETFDTDSLWFKTTRAHDDYFKSLQKKIFVQFTNCIDLSLSSKSKFMKYSKSASRETTCDDMDTPMQSTDEANISSLTNLSETERLSDNVSSLEDGANVSRSQKKSATQFEGLIANYEVSLCCECVQADNSAMLLCRFIGWRK